MVTMQATVRTAPVATPALWTGRAISGLMALFLAFDGAIKVLQLAPAVEGGAQLGYPATATLGLGFLLLACLALYLVPRAAPLGATLLTGYLGGAIATHVRAESPASSVVFPVILGALLWLGLYLRDSRVRALLGGR